MQFQFTEKKVRGAKFGVRGTWAGRDQQNRTDVNECMRQLQACGGMTPNSDMI